MGLFGPPNVERAKSKKDVKGLIRALSYQQDGHVRYMAARYLRHFPDARAVQPLIAALKEKDLFIGDAAGEALVAIGAPAVEPLIVALKDPDWQVRRQAAHALGLIGDPRAVGPLIPLLREGTTDSAAAGALEQLGCTLVDIGAPAVPLLVRRLKDRDVKVRRGAARALVALYQSGKLDEGHRRLILAERSGIAQEHEDRPDHTDRQVRDVRSSDCNYIHTDSKGHRDVGIGVDFPV